MSEVRRKEVRTIAVMTSGGDAPGMNAAIRAVVRTGQYLGRRVMRIQKGFKGLLESDIEEFTSADVSDTIQRGGTILYSARCPEFVQEELQQRAAKICEIFGIDGLIIIGGDGSFKGGKGISKFGVNVVCVPATIDLDIPCTDYTIGFDTAVNTAMENIDRIRDTSASHERISIVEVMGRDCGSIALWCGMVNGAEEILVPEIPTDINYLIKNIMENRKRGKKHNLIINAEGVGGSLELAKQLQEITGITTRATILGHLQRGGSPSALDRMHASMMGSYAAELVCRDTNRIVSFKDGKYTDFDIDEGLAMTRPFMGEKFRVSKIIAMRSKDNTF